MTLTRRRFLTLSAAAAGAAIASPGAAAQTSWQGRAFGADVSLTLHGPRAVTGPALTMTRALLRDVERCFSLYDPASLLVQLNATGQLVPNDHMRALMQAADLAHRITGGLFDPTVQPLWQALAAGTDPASARQAIGWERVQWSAQHIQLGRGQALTFNGIAQGYATDVISAALEQAGLTQTLVNIGEYRSSGGPWSLGLSDPQFGHMGNRTLVDGAIATSSPAATPIGPDGHILHTAAQPHWSTVSVEAKTATLADSLSTALVLAPLEQVRNIRRIAGVRRITLVGMDGDLITL